MTVVKTENLYFCFERKDKSIFVKALNIGIMIDDRTEVMTNLNPLVIKFLLNPDPVEFTEHYHKLINCRFVNNWLEIEKCLF